MFHYIFQMFPELSILGHALLYVYTKQQKYAKYTAHGVLIIFIGIIAKKIMKFTDGILPSYALYRPKGACGCNISCKQSNEGEVGMPSIHSMISGYYSALYNTHMFFIVALSRLGKAENPLFYHSKSGCHTLPQVIIGYIIGYILKSKLID